MNPHILFTITWFHLLVLFLPLSVFLLYWKPHLWHNLLAIFLGSVTGVMNMSGDEIQLPVLLLLVFGFFLGFSEPKRAWRWALMLFMFVPLFECAKLLVNHSFGSIVQEGFGSFAAIIPAFVGTYTGAFIRDAVIRKQSSEISGS